MNELKMQSFEERQLQLLAFFEHEKEYSISQVLSGLEKRGFSLATLKRDLNFLEKQSYLVKTGERRALTYRLSDFGLLMRPFDLTTYSEIPDEKKRARTSYYFKLLEILEKEVIFSSDELSILNEATKLYKNKSTDSSDFVHKKELERFIIELSWKSSKIEGNTYTLLDTERLLREGVLSPLHSKDEAIMIQNHKKAFEYILASKRMSRSILGFRELEHLHKLLVEGLGVPSGMRRGAVGITGSMYLPLAITESIEDELRHMIETIHKKSDSFAKVLIAVLYISYLQPFEDGNKRTSRIFGNGVLLEEGLAPLSYRSVDEKKYREAMLVFYEQNSLLPFKKIFIEQYLFACQNYNLN